jgi:hypothetical protein
VRVRTCTLLLHDIFQWQIFLRKGNFSTWEKKFLWNYMSHALRKRLFESLIKCEAKVVKVMRIEIRNFIFTQFVFHLFLKIQFGLQRMKIFDKYTIELLTQSYLHSVKRWKHRNWKNFDDSLKNETNWSQSFG